MQEIEKETKKKEWGEKKKWEGEEKNYLKWYDEHADDNVSKRQIGYKKICNCLHLTSGCYDPYYQRIANNRNYTYAAIKYR